MEDPVLAVTMQLFSIAPQSSICLHPATLSIATPLSLEQGPFRPRLGRFPRSYQETYILSDEFCPLHVWGISCRASPRNIAWHCAHLRERIIFKFDPFTLLRERRFTKDAILGIVKKLGIASIHCIENRCRETWSRQKLRTPTPSCMAPKTLRRSAQF